MPFRVDDDSKPDRSVTLVKRGPDSRYLFKHDLCGYEFQTYTANFDELVHEIGWLCPRCHGHPLAQPEVG